VGAPQAQQLPHLIILRRHLDQDLVAWMQEGRKIPNVKIYNRGGIISNEIGDP